MVCRISKIDMCVYEYGPKIRELQGRGVHKILDLVAALNSLDDAEGGWTYGKVRRLLARGSELGEMMPARSLSEAARARPYVHRLRSRRSHFRSVPPVCKNGMDRS